MISNNDNQGCVKLRSVTSVCLRFGLLAFAAAHLFLLFPTASYANDQWVELVDQISKTRKTIKDLEYRIRKTEIDLPMRKDGLKRLTEGILSKLEYVPPMKRGGLEFLDKSRYQIHSNIWFLWEYYHDEFIRYKASLGEEKYTYRELGAYLVPREKKFIPQLERGLVYHKKKIGFVPKTPCQTGG